MIILGFIAIAAVSVLFFVICKRRLSIQNLIVIFRFLLSSMRKASLVHASWIHALQTKGAYRTSEDADLCPIARTTGAFEPRYPVLVNRIRATGVNNVSRNPKCAWEHLARNTYVRQPIPANRRRIRVKLVKLVSSSRSNASPNRVLNSGASNWGVQLFEMLVHIKLLTDNKSVCYRGLFVTRQACPSMGIHRTPLW